MTLLRQARLGRNSDGQGHAARNPWARLAAVGARCAHGGGDRGVRRHHHCAGHHHRECRNRPAGLAVRRPGIAGPVGDDRLSASTVGGDPADRVGRGPVRRQTGLDGVAVLVRGRVLALRPGLVARELDRLPGPARTRRGNGRSGRDDAGRAGCRATTDGPGDEHGRHPDDAWPGHRSGAGRCADLSGELAVDLLAQPADRSVDHSLVCPCPDQYSQSRTRAARPRRPAFALAGTGRVDIRCLGGLTARRTCAGRCRRGHPGWAGDAGCVRRARGAPPRRAARPAALRPPHLPAAASIQFLMGAVLVGTMLLLPLYYQVARGESAWVAGLQLMPLGIGAALAMWVTGRYVDRGFGKAVVCTGIPMLAAGFVAYTQGGPGTAPAVLALSLLVIGLGTGCLMAPVSAAAYSVLDRAAIPRATATLNITQRVGGTLGTVAYAVVLQHHLAQVGAEAGTTSLTAAFARTFWWPLVVAALALAPALLLPGRRSGPAPAAQTPRTSQPGRHSPPDDPPPADTHREDELP